MNDLTAHPVRRAAVGVLAGTLACTGAVLTAGAAPASAVEGFAFERLFGDDRYATAAAIATGTFTSAPTAILARGDDFADALTGNYLAGTLDAPVLLTRTGDLPAATAQALEDLNVQEVVIVGGTSAVSSAVQAELARDYDVRRLEGTDRYLTAQAVAEDAAGDGTAVGELDGLRTAVLGNGQNFPDVLAAGPLSYAQGFPLTITRPTALPASTRELLQDLDIEQVVVVGGDTQVSPAVRAEVEQITGNAVRVLAGQTRWETATDIAAFAYDELDFDATHVELARSDRFADALAGGPHAGVERAPIVLTEPTALHPDTQSFLAARSATLADGHVLGGPAAVSDATVAAAERAAAGGGLAVTPDTTATLPVVAGVDADARDERTYTVAGLVSGQEYRITVLQASTVTGSGASAVYTDSDGDGLAETGTRSAVIKAVNGATPTNNTGDGTALTAAPNAQSAVFVAGSSGSATFVLEGVAAESVRPVVYRNGGPGNAATDGGTSPRLELEADRTAKDEADLGGVTTYTTGPAGQTAASVRPELVSAAVVSTTTQEDATEAQPVGTVVRYSFDEEITGTRPVDETRFHVYDLDGTRLTPVDGASTIEASTTSILVRYAAVDTAAEAADLRLATVDVSAVTDNEGLENPIGDAPLGTATATTRTFTAGQTLAPDLVSVGGFRASSTTTTVAFTFDERAFTLRPDGFHLVTTSGQDLTCTAPDSQAGGDPATTAEQGDTTIDAVCPGGNLAAGTTARGYVVAQTVSDNDPDTTPVEGDGRFNPLQSTQTPDAGTTDPDLVSAALQLVADGDDTVTYSFDEPVVVANAAPDDSDPLATDVDGGSGQLDFVAYRADGTQVEAASVVRSSTSSSQVVATFADGDIDEAVGAAVRPSAVTGQTGTAGRANEADEVGMTNNGSATVGQPAGRTAAPDLTAVAATGTGTAVEVVYAFDEDLDTSTTPVVGGQAAVDPAGFFLLQADGTRLQCAEGAVGTTEDTDAQFTCTAYAFVGGGDATGDQVLAAVVGSVANAAVASADADGTANPEGAEALQGSTGTARQ